MKRAVVVATLVMALGLAVGAEEPALADLKFTVVRESDGKPVRNASVILHTLKDDGKQAKGGTQVKTSAEGKAEYPGVPYGKLRVQVIARGYQTFGEDYEIGNKNHEITIKLKRPQEQFSIYK